MASDEQLRMVAMLQDDASDLLRQLDLVRRAVRQEIK